MQPLKVAIIHQKMKPKSSYLASSYWIFSKFIFLFSFLLIFLWKKILIKKTEVWYYKLLLVLLLLLLLLLSLWSPDSKEVIQLLKDGHFARRTCQFSVAKTWEFSGQKFCFLLFSRLLAGKWVGFFLHAGFIFLYLLSSLKIYTEFVVDHPSRRPPPVFLGLGRSEFDTKSNSTRAIYYIYIWAAEQASSRLEIFL
jgi:hypothetical protein